MTRRSAILALCLGGWAVGCGASPVPDASDAESGPDVEWQAISPDLAYNTREGKAVFRYYCAPCHGESGRGDGFNAYNLDPKPRDLADHGFQKERTNEDLASVIRAGGAVAGLSNSMPPWGRTLNERQVHDLISFMRSLPAQIDQENEE